MSFVNPAFLWALPLLGVPIALHMMQWQVPRAVVFPSIRFIKKATDADRGKRGVRDLLTLLMRLCLMALVILLLAGPKTPDIPLAPDDVDGSRTLLIVDLSASMNAGDLGEAIDRALKVISTDAKPGTFMAIGSADGIVHRTTVVTDPKQLREAVSGWKSTLFEGHHAAAVGEGAAYLSGNPTATCYVVSDFQAADWSGEALQQLARAGRVIPIAMASTLDQNVAIVRATAARLAQGKKTGLQVSATVRNFAIDSKDVAVTCRQGDRSISRSLTLSGGETRLAELHLPDAGGTRTELTVTPSDGYVPDDSLWLWTGPRPALPLALWSGKGGNRSLDQFFLGHALTVRRPGHLAIDVNPNGSELLMDGGLDSVRALVVLDGFRGAGPLEIQQIAAWVKAGGMLLCFGGDGFVNGLATLNTEGICATRPGIIHGDRAGLETYFLGKYDTTSPVLAPFADAGLAFDSFPIFRYVGLKPSKGAITLIRFESGDPFLVRERLGKGTVYLIATGLSQGWSELATSRQFLPLVRRLIEASGEVDPGADRVICRPAPDTDQSAEVPGIVTVGDRPTEVNVSRLESNPDRLDPDAVTHELTAEADMAVTSGASVPGDDLTRPFAWAVVAFIILELIVANARWQRSRAPRGGTA